VIKKEKEKKERKKEECQERYERDESSERKIKCKDVTLLRDETSTLFSNHVQSDNEDIIGAS
jgi:hypothetical protein